MRCNVEMSVWTGEDGESIKKIGAEAAFLRAAAKRLMRCRHNADIHSYRLVLAHTLQFSTLEKTQQLGLKCQWHLANLIQKQRAAIRSFNTSCPALYGTSEGAARVSEKLGLQQCLRKWRRSSAQRRVGQPVGSERCRARATTSFPVPVGPWISTVVFRFATRRIHGGLLRAFG